MKDQETTFPLYQGLKTHRVAWLKNRSRVQTLHSGWGCSTNQFTEQCFCYLGCGQFGWTKHNKGNFSQGGFHGTALNVTNHLSWDNLGKRSVSLAHQLPSCQIHMQQSPLQLDECATLFAPLSDNRPVRPLHHLVHCAKIWYELVYSVISDRVHNHKIHFKKHTCMHSQRM